MSSVVSLVGSGLIGRGWAILFANADYQVRLHDSDPQAEQRARPAIAANLKLLEAEGLIDSAATLQARLQYAGDLAEAVDGAFYVQENVVESVAVKAGVFQKLDALTGPRTILASSASAIPPEQFMVGLRHPERCLIAHPFSPPHLIPLVEIVRTRWTSPDVIEETRRLMCELGQRPVLIHKPVVGFAVNRLQAVVIDEAIALVEQGVIDPADLDLCMSHGLGLRWAFMGPFETMDMNSSCGFKEYVTKYGDLYRSILTTVGAPRPWPDQAVDRIEAWRRARYPTEADVTRGRLSRDHNLMKLSKLLRGANPAGRAS